jgi:hypothetical protein
MRPRGFHAISGRINDPGVGHPHVLTIAAVTKGLDADFRRGPGATSTPCDPAHEKTAAIAPPTKINAVTHEIMTESPLRRGMSSATCY